MKEKQNFTTVILWIVYVSLLSALLPHTAWAFANWEPDGGFTVGGFKIPTLTHYVLAFSFEAAIAVLTHKLSKRIEKTPKFSKSKKNADGTLAKVPDDFAKFKFRYFNWFFFLLLVATGVSMLANLAHAVQFGRDLVIFAEWGISPKLYSFAFGGILPVISLGFANVLSEVVEDEEAPNPELIQLNETIKSLREQLRESERRVKATEEKVKAAEEKTKTAEERFGTVTDMAKALFGENKQERILFARKQWKDLPNSAIAVIAESSPAYVSEVLKSTPN